MANKNTPSNPSLTGLAKAREVKLAQAAERTATYGEQVNFSATLPADLVKRLQASALANFRTVSGELAYLLQTTYKE